MYILYIRVCIMSLCVGAKEKRHIFKDYERDVRVITCFLFVQRTVVQILLPNPSEGWSCKGMRAWKQQTGNRKFERERIIQMNTLMGRKWNLDALQTVAVYCAIYLTRFDGTHNCDRKNEQR